MLIHIGYDLGILKRDRSLKKTIYFWMSFVDLVFFQVVRVFSFHLKKKNFTLQKFSLDWLNKVCHMKNYAFPGLAGRPVLSLQFIIIPLDGAG